MSRRLSFGVLLLGCVLSTSGFSDSSPGALAAAQSNFETELTANKELAAQVAKLTKDGYTNVGKTSAFYLQTYECTPGCTERYLVIRPYSHPDKKDRPTARLVAATFNMLTTPGQKKEYYLNGGTTKPLTQEALVDVLGLAK